ncbi:hypothetical protein [Rhodobacter ferrooxidans]|uniref:Uncharacterized protein n=1 Tax=Rhodobacter ferrooxidans TaxID=371731 RepID=C8RYY5_9RHOB|nr:hypothetical protein [Rhodobacter sp. SW2]EEW25942.1 conserved hypothetical protein [Rhodobacter sp. SW2]
MSEALSSVEIEDVLSSIRRLVSEDLRPASRTAPVPAETEPAHKLILTPALRVVGADEAPETVAEGAGEPVAEGVVEIVAAAAAPDPVAEVAPEAAADIAPETPPAAAPTIEAVVSAVGAAVGTQPWEDEADDTALATDWPPEAWPEPVSDAGAEAAPEHSPADAVEDAEVVTSASPAAVMAAIEWGPTEAWGEMDEPAATVEVLSAAPPPEPAARLQDDIAEAAAVAEIQRAEARAAEAATAEATTGNSGPIPQFRHAAQAPQPEPRVAAPDPEGIASVFDQDDSVLDEEVLRELVRDIIREELQGTLGERITRNVRKLVRVEINRALSSREFDGS